ncbi:MAG TPA: hypothetical protein VFO55_10970 [Gemmatimonadaceae bacterium]|nr:hypothetical protein [Gemmatimonadaceae bacterium]
MRSPLVFALALFVIGCRIEKLKSGDATRGNVEPGPGIPACGIAPESRVSEDGLGLLRIGVSLDAIRGSCAIVSEQSGSETEPATARVDLGRDTALVELKQGRINRITLHHQAYRTSDSLGVGTHVSTLMRLREAVGVTEGNRLYAVSPAYCGLRFMLAEPAPPPPSAQSGRAALRRLSGETRTRELEIVGCQRRR